jgi:hypothetical protein
MRRLVCDLTFVSLIALAFTGCGASSANNDIHGNIKRTDPDAATQRDDGAFGVNDGGVTDGGRKGSKPDKSNDGGTTRDDEGPAGDDDDTLTGSTSTSSSGSDAATNGPGPTDDDTDDDDDDVGPTVPDDSSDTDDTDPAAGGAGNEPSDDDGPRIDGGRDPDTDTDTDDTDDVTTDPDVTIPEELEDCSHDGTGYEGYCYSNYYCDGKQTQAYSECSEYEDGPRCSCSAYQSNGTSVNMEFKVPKIDGQATCDMVAGICADGDQPEFTGEFKCSVTSESLDDYGCNRQQQCVRETEVSGLVATERRYKQLSCYNYSGGDDLDCSCDDGLNPQNNRHVLLSDVDPADACGVMTDLCWNGISPTPVGTPTCAPDPAQQNASDTGCSDGIRCDQATTVDGEETTISQTTYANCSKSSGGWGCTCQLDNASIEFNVTPQAESADTCSNAVATCDDALATETPGDLTCEYYSTDSYGPDNCGAQLKCYKEGTLGDTKVRRTGFVSTNCYKNGSEWSCSCYSQNTGENKQVAADSSLTMDEVCLEAVATCVGEVDPSVGYTNYGGGFPTPGIDVPVSMTPTAPGK